MSQDVDPWELFPLPPEQRRKIRQYIAQCVAQGTGELEARLRSALVVSAAILKAHGGTVDLLDAEVDRMIADAPVVLREIIPGGFRLILTEQEGTES